MLITIEKEFPGLKILIFKNFLAWLSKFFSLNCPTRSRRKKFRQSIDKKKS
jgi:hypothetical protein